MPFTNIHWIKLERRLLNDYRFYSMDEGAQLIFMKLLMLAAETNNKIPKNYALIKSSLRSHQTESKIEEHIKEIKKSFPKFKENKSFYFFREWSNRCNWIANKELLGNSQGTPKDAIEKKRKDKIRIDKIVEEFLALKDWDKKRFGFVRTRWSRAIKDLLLNTKDTDEAISALRWTAEKIGAKGLNWGIETVLKWLPEWEKTKPSEKVKEFVEKYGKEGG